VFRHADGILLRLDKMYQRKTAEIYSISSRMISMNVENSHRQQRMVAVAVGLILAGSGLLRLYHINVPLVDGFWDKQIAVANRSRNMAGPPFHLLSASFDFCISADGRRSPYTEEIPVYHGLVALGYRIFGEQDWFGRAISAAGSLLAILAFIGLMRREFDDAFALVAGTIFAVCPLLIFYGRAVVPDTCMLGFMLATAYCFRRAVDENSRTWLIISGLAGLFAVGLKYYGLMILLPMTEMAWRGHGIRGLIKLCVPGSIMIVPLAAWMILIFFQTANPARGDVYFIFQQPGVLLMHDFWARLADRFLWKSCGPLTTILMGVGVYAFLFRRKKSSVIGSWMLMGLLFYFILGPKAYGHEYYELMMLPGAAGCAAMGWCFLFQRSFKKYRLRHVPIAAGACMLVLTAVVQSPLVVEGRFRQDIGFVIAAQSAQNYCSPQGRVAVGPLTPQPIIHYARREGWTWQEYPQDLQNQLECYRRHGAECVVLYFDRKTPPQERRRYDTLLNTLPILNHQSGPWGLGATQCEFYVLQLGDSRGGVQMASKLKIDKATR
jgi:4-amino-4-deoxy-L-arabinose transferase-like glycosyltransferase